MDVELELTRRKMSKVMADFREAMAVHKKVIKLIPWPGRLFGYIRLYWLWYLHPRTIELRWIITTARIEIWLYSKMFNRMEP